MSEWYEEIFDSDYIKTYTETEKKTPKDVDGVIELLSPLQSMKILDLCCGYGRHSLELARRGFNVTGYDLSGYFLDYARKEADKDNLKIKFIEGDVRDLSFEEEFDIVLNLLTSFGYFSDEENREVMANISRALVPGGRLLIQLLHPYGLIRTHNPDMAFVVKGDGVTGYDNSTWDLEKNILNVTRCLYFSDGRKREYNFPIRAYSLTEMIVMLEKNDLQIVDYFGSLQGDPFTYESRHQVIIAEKSL